MAYNFEVPWHSPGQWDEVNESIRYLTGRYRSELSRAATLAREAGTHLKALFPVMAELCALTCPTCNASCCVAATPWYNFQDLLFLHLSGQQIPSAQPVSASRRICRYLKASGCALPRMARPWICTWYVCPPQTAILREKQCLNAQMDQIIREIKNRRTAIEAAFIRVIAPVPP